MSNIENAYRPIRKYLLNNLNHLNRLFLKYENDLIKYKNKYSKNSIYLNSKYLKKNLIRTLFLSQLLLKKTKSMKKIELEEILKKKKFSKLNLFFNFKLSFKFKFEFLKMLKIKNYTSNDFKIFLKICENIFEEFSEISTKRL